MFHLAAFAFGASPGLAFVHVDARIPRPVIEFSLVEYAIKLPSLVVRFRCRVLRDIDGVFQLRLGV